MFEATVSIFAKNKRSVWGKKDLFSRFPTFDMDAVTKFTTRKSLYLVPKAEKYYQKAVWAIICTLCTLTPRTSEMQESSSECLDRTFRVKEIKTQSTRVSVITGIPVFWCWTPHRFLLWHHLQHLYLLLNIFFWWHNICVLNLNGLKLILSSAFCNICWAFLDILFWRLSLNTNRLSPLNKWYMILIFGSSFLILAQKCLK